MDVFFIVGELDFVPLRVIKGLGHDVLVITRGERESEEEDVGLFLCRLDGNGYKLVPWQLGRRLPLPREYGGNLKGTTAISGAPNFELYPSLLHHVARFPNSGFRESTRSTKK
jgi:hypothetical protein